MNATTSLYSTRWSRLTSAAPVVSEDGDGPDGGVDVDQGATDDAEFVELRNTGSITLERDARIIVPTGAEAILSGGGTVTFNSYGYIRGRLINLGVNQGAWLLLLRRFKCPLLPCPGVCRFPHPPILAGLDSWRTYRPERAGLWRARCAL